MRFVVTGAAGFIGSHLTEALRARGDEVVAVDCFTDYYDPALKEDNASAYDVARLDLAADDLALDGFDGVFHLAGQPGVRSSFQAFDNYVRRRSRPSQIPARVREPRGQNRRVQAARPGAAAQGPRHRAEHGATARVRVGCSERRTRRVRVVVVGVRRRGELPDFRRCGRGADLPVRDLEARM